MLSVGVIAESTLDTICYFLVRVVFLMYPLWFTFSFFVREARPVSYFGLSRVRSAFMNYEGVRVRSREGFLAGFFLHGLTVTE